MVAQIRKCGIGKWDNFGILITKHHHSLMLTRPSGGSRYEKEGTLSEKIPINHSGLFYPVIQPTLTVATDGYAAAALTWLGKK